jgi:hypothetical protein
MSIPTAVFLDTSVLDAQQYNFESTALATFVPACASRAVALLLPDPIEREITRHIRDRSVQALSALLEARRKAPFLAKWRGFTQELRSPQAEALEVQRVARSEWAAFLNRFHVVRLGYDLLDVATVMNWYDRAEAPFNEGKKRKEFPDAFAIAMLDTYAQRQGICIAVVSADPDFKNACQRFGSLLYFETLPRLTEVLLSDDRRVEQLRQAIRAKLDVLEEAVLNEVPAVTLYHELAAFVVQDAEFEEAHVNPSVVGIGDGECTIAFDAVISGRFELRFEADDEVVEFEESTRDSFELSGTAKATFDKTTNELSRITYIAFDQSEARIRATPEL